MSFKSSVAASAWQHDGLKRLAGSANPAEADPARAILLSLVSLKERRQIGEVFGVREDTVRNWRSIFMREGLAGIERHPAPGCAPVKAEAALEVAREPKVLVAELFAAPVENRIKGTLPRRAEEIARRSLHRHSRLSVLLRKKGALPTSASAPR